MEKRIEHMEVCQISGTPLDRSYYLLELPILKIQVHQDGSWGITQRGIMTMGEAQVGSCNKERFEELKRMAGMAAAENN